MHFLFSLFLWGGNCVIFPQKNDVTVSQTNTIFSHGKLKLLNCEQILQQLSCVLLTYMINEGSIFTVPHSVLHTLFSFLRYNLLLLNSDRI